VTGTKNAGMFGLLLLMLLTGCDIVAPDDQYRLGLDSEIQLGVAQGAVRELTLPPSKVYPGYTHRAWLYITGPIFWTNRNRLNGLPGWWGPLSHATVRGVFQQSSTTSLSAKSYRSWRQYSSTRDAQGMTTD
jgi:hypothetical protein